jgi:alpha-glucoside transport system substrate-binding protein
MWEKKILSLPVSLLLLLGMVLDACSSQTATQPPALTQVPAVTEAPTGAPATPKPPTEPIAATTEAPSTGGAIDCMGAQPGDTLNVLHPWPGMEGENLIKILKPLVDACGIVLKPELLSDQALLTTRVQAGSPPDIAITTKVSLLSQYNTLLKPMTDLGVHAENYSDFWMKIGTIDGSWLGLPLKVDIQTIIWYSPVKFQALGYEVPSTVTAFLAQLSKMASDGNVPWSNGFESGETTGQTGADAIEDLLLIDDGPDYINDLINGSIPYNSSGVGSAYLTYRKWATDPSYTVGGAQGTITTNINDALYKIFSDPPGAMMARQPGSAGEAIASKYPNLKFGRDYDFYQVPGAQQKSLLHGTTDWMLAFNDSAAVKALAAYLSSDQGGQMWAQVGLGNTPNSAGTNAYTNERLQKQAQVLANTESFVPEISDAIPGEFASAQRKAIVDFVNGANLVTVLNGVTAAQMQALGK